MWIVRLYTAARRLGGRVIMTGGHGHGRYRRIKMVVVDARSCRERKESLAESRRVARSHDEGTSRTKRLITLLDRQVQGPCACDGHDTIPEGTERLVTGVSGLSLWPVGSGTWGPKMDPRGGGACEQRSESMG